MSDLAAVITLWAATITCFAVIIVVARCSRVPDMDAETAAMWAEACPWPVKDDGPFHNDGATIP